MKISELRKIYSFCEENSISFRDVVENIDDSNNDFEVDGYRFILEEDIDQIQVEELESDPYALGAFNDWFISYNTDLSVDIVRALQESDKYDKIGEHIIDNGYTEAMQQEYSSLDGYGHHFATYDGDTMEDLLSIGYYSFRVA